jgi:MarR family 2-MHQ and catechol resistance regulon transcriptional repressor
MKKDSQNNKLENDLEVLKEVFTVFKLASKYYDKICKELNITQVQFEALYLLYISEDNCVKMSELGDKLEMARSGVTILVDRMALAGLAKRRPDVEDRRIINVMITEKGNEIMKELIPSNEIFKLSTLDFIQKEEKELLCKLITQLSQEKSDSFSLI